MFYHSAISACFHSLEQMKDVLLHTLRFRDHTALFILFQCCEIGIGRLVLLDDAHESSC